LKIKGDDAYEKVPRESFPEGKKVSLPGEVDFEGEL